MDQNYIKLYSNSTGTDAVFFLNEGRVFFYVSDMDKYVIKGKNLVIGATEVIMNNLLEMQTVRLETAVTDRESKIQKFSVEKFLRGLDSYSFALNVSMVIAKQVLLTTQIINKNLNELSGETNRNKDLSINFYQIIDRLKKEYDKRRLPWLSDLLKKHETTLTCKRGEAFFHSMEPTKITSTTHLSGNMVEYARGSIICEENTKGEEMYILQSGTIDVLVNNNSVATLNDSGTVFGEMALLLNEKRTATLSAKNNVVLSKITKENLKEISEKQGDLLKDLTGSLAKKHYYNIIKIESINQSLVEKTFSDIEGDTNKGSVIVKTEKELGILKRDVEEYSRQKESEFLSDLLESF